MKFEEPEVIEMGLADELIQDVEDLNNSEAAMPSRIKRVLPVYIAEAE